MGLAEIEKTTAGAATFVKSELFARTFREGMSLVEETANYLDGEGREVSKTLSRDAALTYAGVSMRLTTQLMQIASWLLVLRAVREGEMGVNEAQEEKYRLEISDDIRADLKSEGMPDKLEELVDKTRQLYRRIARLDAELFSAQAPQTPEADAAGQQRALLKAFGGGQ